MADKLNPGLSLELLSPQPTHQHAPRKHGQAHAYPEALHAKSRPTYLALRSPYGYSQIRDNPLEQRYSNRHSVEALSDVLSCQIIPFKTTAGLVPVARRVMATHN